MPFDLTSKHRVSANDQGLIVKFECCEIDNFTVITYRWLIRRILWIYNTIINTRSQSPRQYLLMYSVVLHVECMNEKKYQTGSACDPDEFNVVRHLTGTKNALVISTSMAYHNPFR